MADFKLTINDPKTGKAYQKDIKEDAAKPFIGLNIGEAVKGDGFGLAGYEFQITGGSDYCGFPMRRGILGMRKRINIFKGVGFRGSDYGIRMRKTVCGHKIHDKITQINLKVTKEGASALADVLGKTEKKEEAAQA